MRINGEIADFQTRLHNGDQIEIMTSSDQTPSRQWLQYVRTPRARQSIRQWFRRQERNTSIRMGEQIIREAVEMGRSDILDYLDDEQLVFIDASGREFSNFIRKELPAFVADWKGSNARIAIDPLTPVLWSTKDLYEQRDLIGFMFKETRKVGTVLCTLEEHGATDLTGPETVIPMYLADCVIHLRFDHVAAKHTRELQIIKCRNSRHDQEPHPYEILKGLGIVLQDVDLHRTATAKVPSQLRQMLLPRAIPRDVRDRLEKSLDSLTDEDFRTLKPEQVLELILQEYTAGG